MKILCTLAICLTSAVAVAQRETFDIASFVPPSGWKKQVKEGGYVAFLNSNEKGYCNLVLYASRAGSDTPLNEFKNEWNDLVKKSKGANYQTPPQVDGPDNGWYGVGSATWVAPSGEKPFLAIVTTLVGHGRVTSVVALISDTVAFLKPVLRFLESIEPIATAATASPKGNSSPAAVPTPAGTGGLTGLWVGLGTTTTTFGITNAAGTGYAATGTHSSMHRSSIVFFPDGTFCGVIPTAGFHVDFAEMRAKLPYYWGTYTFNGSGGMIRLNGTDFPFTFSNSKLKYSGVDFEFHYPSADGQHFDGTYTAEKDAPHYTQYMKAEPTITFTADGHFADNGAIYWMRHVRASTNDMTDQNTGSGKYEISNYTMTFHYDDGRRIDIALLSVSGGDRTHPSQLSFEPAILDRK